ncbi:gamma-glutamyl-gamma-aminobutyrate hydrolase [Philodulcilactobacillus myokoensis]|uniref:Gamma-glutamyl-gamma-aminobutyrate hydrolase n=1 Tax=Philodulcilactobacillus myokoensis TaxID=2929573 RepID=A0A9W6B3Z1_9LACO|nr:gamma-glutamyl-gamma-aminobutyrate hydrolase family protein [Philodulcilactobacillus myokoensis]GLB47595.1 gamma-glutamyl-gamma-aminobutyrate hydrolase [Philodulcilactobacillus myokoensis]
MRIGISAQPSFSYTSGFKMIRSEFPQSVLDVCSKMHVTPIIMPATQSDEDIISILKMVDGVIITGGSDVSSDLYGQHHLDFQKIDAMPSQSRKRDLFELRLIKLATHFNKPVLGICRGIQIINVAFGGTLYQDIDTYFDDLSHQIKHFQDDESSKPTHYVDIKRESMLYDSVGSRPKVNSFHHQAIDQVGHGLSVVAKAPDGVIEGVESADNLVQGVQWHPEQLWKKHPIQENIFKDFFSRAKSLTRSSYTRVV